MTIVAFFFCRIVEILFIKELKEFLGSTEEELDQTRFQKVFKVLMDLGKSYASNFNL